jgi:hypothetical protein
VLASARCIECAFYTEGDTAAINLDGVSIHKITKKPANIYVLDLYDFDAI